MAADILNILLVDDHSLFREGLKGMLELDDRMRVVAESGSATEAIEKLNTAHIDVALIDLNLPGRDGIWLVQKIRARLPNLPILILSMHDGSHEILKALAEGANGYLTKTVSREELLAAIQTVVNGGTHLSQAAAQPVLQRLSQMRPESNPPELSERELTILQLVIAGKNNGEIAKDVSLSISRVKFHLSELFTKFSVNDRTSLAVEASKFGFNDH